MTAKGVPLFELRLDLDRKWSACAWVKWCEATAKCLKHAEVEVARVSVTETRRGFHVVLTLTQSLPSAIHVVALQAVLGSDRVREAMNFRRATSRYDHDWNRLFDVKHVFDADGSVTRSTAKPRIQYKRILQRALGVEP